MDKSLIDSIVFLPVEPWTPTKKVYENLNHERFILLGSFDIHNWDINKIRKKLKIYLEKYRIKGIKLHPNLQGFKPRPSDNDEKIKQKLKTIYRFAEKNNLYLLFHGGISFYTKEKNKKFKNYPRSTNYAVIENFFDNKGKCEILENFKVKMIIAHLCHFGLGKINYELVKLATKRYKNLYFDTAAVSFKLTEKYIDMIGDEKIILGSDAAYNGMFNSVANIYKISQKFKKNKQIKVCKNILAKNYLRIINSQLNN
jgi:predicted TIM-barrel fold metal-dependent hydrolase